MTTDFLIAFGGTGARVVEALTYLYAAGCQRQSLYVLLIDPDGANGNVSVTRDQLVKYLDLNAVFDTASAGNGRDGVFFGPDINRQGPSTLFWEYPNRRKPFKTLLAYDGLPDDQRALADLLYDEEDLSRTFEVGYVGRAHVGSLDLYRTIRAAIARVAEAQDSADVADLDAIDRFFFQLRAEAQSRRARLLVAGSIFGGTGASGIPAVPALVTELLPSVRERVALGSLLIGPYFSFPPADEAAPDSALHPLATRAALYHYGETHVGFDAVYFMGAPNRLGTADHNNPGGTNQRNRPHYVELGAATAALHFFQAPEIAAAEEAQVLTSGSRGIPWDGFPGEASLGLRRRLASFTAAMLMHCHFLHEMFESGGQEGWPWYSKVSQGGGTLRGREDELVVLRDFGLRYLEWFRQVSASAPKILLNIPERVGEEALSGLLEEPERRPHAYHRFHTELDRAKPARRPAAMARYLDVLSRASLAFCSIEYPSWKWTP
ncbi:MAG: hypothetical protein RH859_09425 [Longimicrobiales bacterium]